MPSTELCTLTDEAGQNRLAGTVLTVRSGEPVEIRYAVTCEGSWATRAAVVEIGGTAANERIELEVDASGAWMRNGRPARGIEDGVIDVDLGFSPCTNTLPIRRLALDVGASARIAVAWLLFPELDLVRTEQVYTRLGESRYRFETGTGDFTAELDVDPHGIVTRYGGFWREVPPPRALS